MTGPSPPGRKRVWAPSDWPFTAVEILTDALAAVERPEAARTKACLGLGGMVRATAAAYLGLDLSSATCAILCWPRMTESVLLRLRTHEKVETVRALSAAPGSFGERPLEAPWHRTAAFAILRETLGLAPLAHLSLPYGPTERVGHGAGATLLLFSSNGGFTPAEVRLLQVMQRPLAVLDEHVRRVEGLLAGAPDEGAGVHRSLGARELADNLGLTAREVEVLVMLSHGLLARTIAERLSVSPRTVHKHLGSLYRKLDAHDRLVAVNRARDIGLLSSPAQHA